MSQEKWTEMRRVTAHLLYLEKMLADLKIQRDGNIHAVEEIQKMIDRAKQDREMHLKNREAIPSGSGQEMFLKFIKDWDGKIDYALTTLHQQNVELDAKNKDIGVCGNMVKMLKEDVTEGLAIFLKAKKWITLASLTDLTMVRILRTIPGDKNFRFTLSAIIDEGEAMLMKSLADDLGIPKLDCFSFTVLESCSDGIKGAFRNLSPGEIADLMADFSLSS